ncbi:MAG: hypothetical protein ACRENK_03395 [Gemmatimonadaceae bacterium]
MNDKLTHKHFKQETRLPYPGERIIFCSCSSEPAVVKQFNETVTSEPCEESKLGCGVRKQAAIG